MFSVREVEYLESLPAVSRVRNGRILYEEGFKRHCVRCYREGESPAEFFRRAGLDSMLLGYKRIERCMARWRHTVQPERPGADAPQRTDPADGSAASETVGDVPVESSDATPGESEELTARPSGGATGGTAAGTRDGADDDSAASSAAASEHDGHRHHGASHASIYDIPASRRWSPPPSMRLAAAEGSGRRYYVDDSMDDPIAAGIPSADDRGIGMLIIAQQARRIDELERQVARLNEVIARTGGGADFPSPPPYPSADRPPFPR